MIYRLNDSYICGKINTEFKFEELQSKINDEIEKINKFEKITWFDPNTKDY